MSVVWCGPLDYDSVYTNNIIVVPFVAADSLILIKNKLKNKAAYTNLNPEVIDRFISEVDTSYGYNGHFGFSWK